jgi:hypothetical protein
MSPEADEAPRHEYSATLRVSSQTLRLSQLTETLGEPSDGYDIGDPVSSRRPDSGRRRHSMWLLESGLDRTRPLDEQIEKLVAFVEAHRQIVDSLREQCTVDIFCGLFSGDGATGGFIISPGLSTRLADVQLPVDFDIY